MDEIGERIKVKHRRSADFSSVYASGVISSVVPTTGLLNLTFYEDVIGVVSETLERTSSNQVTSIFKVAGIPSPRQFQIRKR